MLALTSLLAGCPPPDIIPDAGFIFPEAGVTGMDASPVGFDAQPVANDAEPARDAGQGQDATSVDAVADAAIVDTGVVMDSGQPDTGMPPVDAGGVAYDDCHVTRFSGSGDGSNRTGGWIEIDSAWTNPGGHGPAGLTQFTLMMHLSHASLSGGPFGGPLIRNVPFMQWGPGGDVMLGRMEPEWGGDYRVYFGGPGSPYVTAPMVYDQPLQFVLVYDGTQANNVDRARLYRWVSGETAGLVDVGTVADFAGGTASIPTQLPPSTEMFRIGGGVIPNHPDLDGDLHSFAVWEVALDPATVVGLNTGSAVVDPRTVNPPPDLYFPLDEGPGATTVDRKSVV